MNSNPSGNAPGLLPDAAEEAWLSELRERVRRLRFGTVQVIVHEGRVTQIDSTERIRFDRSRVRDA